MSQKPSGIEIMCRGLAVRPWENHSASLYLNSPICKMGVTLGSLRGGCHAVGCESVNSSSQGGGRIEKSLSKETFQSEGGQPPPKHGGLGAGEGVGGQQVGSVKSCGKIHIT